MKKSQPAVLQAEEKRARNSVPKCPCKLLQPANRPMAGSSSLEGHFGTGLHARFSSAWSTAGCEIKNPHLKILKMQNKENEGKNKMTFFEEGSRL